MMLLTTKQAEVLRRIRDNGRAARDVDEVTGKQVYFAGEHRVSSTVLTALIEKGLLDPLVLAINEAGLAAIEWADRQAEEAGNDG